MFPDDRSGTRIPSHMDNLPCSARHPFFQIASGELQPAEDSDVHIYHRRPYSSLLGNGLYYIIAYKVNLTFNSFGCETESSKYQEQASPFRL